MHRKFLGSLVDATGSAVFVVAIFLDVRDFTTFFGESAESTTFLKKAYQEILRADFPDADFVKATGDGLMLIYEYRDGDDIPALANKTVGAALTLLGRFPRLVTSDPLITFHTPDRIGIGLARGAASKLATKDTILDYSGRTLNLAARLMDLARPQGIVLDGDFRVELLSDEVGAKFTEEHVYIRGISPEHPHTVYVTAGLTNIPETARNSLVSDNWITVTEEMPFANFKNFTGAMIQPLDAEPIAEAKPIVVLTYFARQDNGQKKYFSQRVKVPATIRYDGHEAALRADVKPAIRAMTGEGVHDEDPVTVVCMYLARPEPPTGPVAVRGSTKKPQPAKAPVTT